ncbi:type I restriction endonuclease subunit R [Winogradskyella litoriviva]|uniref:Type I restriction enzyme endonuclease subunit n=1 Tax=Winogradskyella litoriviva TaxID=1220182 RepID=A0ABX2E339_9FLAO|nr:type I restriction endonuclease subunit R [Winogradskyella litoriviva]NRD22705.1 type I restriction endonuclease subunit R [Winogradskyella litoriviva]
MLNEDKIEQAFIDQLVGQGYTYFYGPDIAPYSDNPQREGFESVLLEQQLKNALQQLNPEVPESARVEAYNKIVNLGTQDLMENNERFHTMLTNGVTVEYHKDGRTKGINVKLLDVAQPQNNQFWVVNQLVVKENNNEKRFDVVIYINGLPLVFVELKNATDENATVKKAYRQIQNYKTAVPSIFYYNSICVISDGIDAKTSSVSAPFSRFLSWKAPIKTDNDPRTELQILTEYMLNKKTVVELIRYCTVFEQEEKKDEKTGLIFQIKIKKVAAYHQYYAVQKAVAQTIRATDSKEGDRKVGVVWHTQGSGKSLSMVFYSGQIVTHTQMENPTIVVLTDRNDLDDQLFATFGNCKELLRQTPVQAQSRDHIKELLNVSGGGVIFTTIQKFSPEEGNVFDTLSERTNIVVVADEAHRSQYGFKARVVDVEEGSEIRYGNAKYLRDALPNASYIGFTGTPIEKEDKSTPAVFGEYIDVYDIKQAVDDGATVPISYESRLVKIKLNEEVTKSIDAQIDAIEGASEEQIEKAKTKSAAIEKIIGKDDRLKDIATDLVSHFEARQQVFEGKAMIVSMSRKICAKLYNEIIALRPDWHHDDLDKGAIKVIMTSTSDDEAILQPHHTTKAQRKVLAARIKDPNDPLQMVIVRDMWLTGFDAPNLHTMYIDKKMQGANLMQAIARVNRVYKDKPGGLIVDYIGIGQDLRNAMATYLQSGGEGTPIVDIKEAIAGMLEKFEVVEQILHGYDYQSYFKADTNTKLQILLGAQNFVLQTEDVKNRFIKEVTLLSKLFAMSIPSPQADNIKDEVAFFQAVKARINKFTGNSTKSDYEVETAIKQIVDDALSSEGVIDVFEAAGIKAPSVGILSDEFLLEVKNMQQKNVAFELLKKLLADEVRVRKTKNIAQGKRFSEMLESVVKRYHNNQIDSAQVLAELSAIAKDMRLEDKKSVDLGLTPEEYAFYSVLSQNESTSFLDDDKMKELIHTIVDVVRNNATVDWSKRDDVRAKLRLTVKKILMRYGYPPDVAKMEADKVLAQSENLAAFFAKA